MSTTTERMRRRQPLRRGKGRDRPRKAARAAKRDLQKWIENQRERG